MHVLCTVSAKSKFLKCYLKAPAYSRAICRVSPKSRDVQRDKRKNSKELKKASFVEDDKSWTADVLQYTYVLYVCTYFRNKYMTFLLTAYIIILHVWQLYMHVYMKVCTHAYLKLVYIYICMYLFARTHAHI